MEVSGADVIVFNSDSLVVAVGAGVVLVGLSFMASAAKAENASFFSPPFVVVVDAS